MSTNEKVTVCDEQPHIDIVPSKGEDVTAEHIQDHLKGSDAITLAKSSLSLRSKATYRLVLVTFVWGLSVAAFAIDASVISSLASLKIFRDYYGVESTGAKWGLVVAIYAIGNIVCSCFQWVGDIIGRRGIAFVGCIILTIGCVIQAVAPNINIMMAGRFVAGGGSALTATMGPSYMAEVTPPCYRGLCVGIYCSCYYLGAICIAGVTLGASYMNNIWCFRLPLTFQIGPPVIVAFLLYLCTPESPRFLIAVGKIDQAKRVIAKYQTNSESIDDPVVELTVKQIQDSLERNTVKPWDFTTFVRTKSGRYRLWVIFLYSIMQQWNGAGLIGYFLPGVLNMVGITNSQHQLGVNLGMVAATWACTLIGASFVDKVTRRFILITTLAVYSVLLAAMALVNALYQHDVAVKAMGYLTIMLVMFVNIATGLFLNVLHNIYPSEVLHYTQRAKGMGLYSLFQGAFGFANNYGGSAALQALQWKVYIVFLGINIFNMIMAYFFYPEFRHLTLEEIDFVFEMKDKKGPVKVSKQLQKAKVQKIKEDHAALYGSRD